jgi:hypothetical protein
MVTITRTRPSRVGAATTPLLLLHGIHLNDYRGLDSGFYPGGFKWAAEHRWGGEVFNFKPEGGRCYGHVEVLDHSIHVEHLGTTPDAEAIDGVLVVWTAPDPTPRRGRIVVGWYRNATVHRWRQHPEGSLKCARTFRDPKTGERHVFSYQVEAAEEDCTLLPPEERVLWIPPRRQGDKGIPGQSPVYFPERQTAPAGPEIARRIRRFIETGEALSLAEAVSSPPARPRGSHQPDPERRKEIEKAAVKLVRGHFDGLGYDLQTVESENCGYDLLATRGDAVLCIEVKGRSGAEVAADFTFNEFDKIKLEQKGKFEDGSYRICIVTDALNENGGATLHHFWCVQPTAEEKARGATLQWRNVNGPGVLRFTAREAARGAVED